MIRAALTSIVILVVCFMENIGHYFGVCFHGLLSQLVTWLAAGGLCFAMYFKNIQLWLNTRPNRPQHKCKDHHHINKED